LAGKSYPNGIPIYLEEKLSQVIKKFDVNQVVLAYSDLSHEEVMHKASIALAAGADFRLMGPKLTMLKSVKPVISVCAVRTGAGKSPVSRKISLMLRKMGYRVVIIRHPMPYGDLTRQICQRFASYKDLDKQKCTIEEREDYEPHIDNGFVVYAGVDYEKILRIAEREADIIIWDGGNNDLPFIKPDLHIVVADALRPGHELSYHPGEANLRMADIVIINKADTDKKAVDTVVNNVRKTNPHAVIIKSRMVLSVGRPELIKGKKVLVIEDGPTLTHGGMPYGAGYVAAVKYRAKIIDPKPYAVGKIKSRLKEYPHIRSVLPAVGYNPIEIKELEEIINSVKCDVVVVATPIDLRRFMKIKKPSVRVRYEIKEMGKPTIEDVIRKFLRSSQRF
jgi:predicted GTPase